MTFSIVGIDANGDLGIAVASKFPAAGAAVPWARAGVGAIATQAAANTAFGPDGLGLMARGMDASSALDALLAADDDREERQAGFVDARGGLATYTGSACTDWAGGVTGDGFAAQGNILAEEAVIDAMADAFTSTDGELCDRLLASLLAGDAAGGDRRGKQSAAMLVVRAAGGYLGMNDRYVDLRVDDHPEAPAELARVFDVWEDTMLVRSDVTVEATPDVVRALQRGLRSLGYLGAAGDGVFDAPTRAAFEEWAGWENLEMHLREDGRIAERLIDGLRRQASGPA